MHPTPTPLHRRHFLRTTALGSLAFTSSPFWADFSPDARTEVLVLGAGLSGLYTALLLEEKGYVVTVLEANPLRVGGRLYTLDDVPGSPNAGGTEVGDGYQRVVAMAQKLGVALQEPTPEPRTPGLMSIGGNLVKETDWAASPHNRLTEVERKILPALLESTLMLGKNPLQTLDDWYNPAFSEFDVPFAEFLRKNGVSDEARRLINSNANTNDITTTSTLNVLKSMTFRAKSGSRKTLRIAGGSQRLPEAMAKALKKPVKLGKLVRRIETRPDGVGVTCSDGSRYRANFAVCTLPFSVLRHVEISPVPTGIRGEAIQNLPYTAITQIHLAAKSNFWESDGLPATTWTDSLTGRFFADKSPDGTPRYLCWINGLEALALDQLDEKTVREKVLRDFARLRPATKGQLEVLKVVSWGTNSYAKGAYYHLAPGQASRFYPAILQPMNRLHFAGEHTALLNNGMEAAMESAERVVGEVMKAS